MSDLMPSSVLLAILQNQIRNAVDNSKFPIYKTIGYASELTEEEKNDISKNVYQFLIDSYGNLYVLDYHSAEDDWAYYNFGYSTNYVLDSSTETPQYKIVLATYNVNTAKVTFVEKVLP